MRPVERYPSRPCRSASICSVPGCSNSTRERKPWCTAHIGHSPYVTQLLRDLGRPNSLSVCEFSSGERGGVALLAAGPPQEL